MRFPEYIQYKKSPVYCMATVTDNYDVIVGDDHLYEFFEKLVGINFLEYIHPDYKGEFIEMVHSLGLDKSGRAIVPIRDGGGDYHLNALLISAVVTVDDELVYEIEMCNILNIENKYAAIFFDATKYKLFLSMYQDCYFDYDMTKDVFTVFKYMNIRATILIKDTFENSYNSMLPYFKDEKDREVFTQFMERVKNPSLNFDYTIKVPDPNDHNLYKIAKIESMIAYRPNREKVVIGKISYLNSEGNEVVPFYKTEAGKDSATGLLNKKACYEYTVDTLSAGSDTHYMAIIDIDNFKDINDTYGHLFGDEVINTTAQIISAAIIGRGIVGRFGGDEFFILTSYIKNELELRSVLTSMRSKILTAFDSKVKGLRVTVSVGVCAYPQDGREYYELFKKADRCLYRAKEKGKNRYIIYNEKVHSYMNDENKNITMAHTRKSEMLSESIADIASVLYSSDTNRINKALNLILNRFDMDGIRLYVNNLNRPEYMCGNYDLLEEGKFTVYPSILKMFDNKKYFLSNNILNFQMTDSQLYHSCKEWGVTSFAAFSLTNSSKDDVIIFYDVFKNSNRWSDSEKNLLLAVSKMICENISK